MLGRVLTFIFLVSLCLAQFGCGDSDSAPKPLAAETTQTYQWMNDLDKAQVTAAGSNRDIFLIFTGSDWCKPCMELEEKVLSKIDFLRDINQSFVLVKADFPHNTQLPPEQLKKQEEWMKTYMNQSFPHIVLMNARREAYASTLPIENPTVPRYLEHLHKIQQLGKSSMNMFLKAQTLEGEEKVKALHQALATANTAGGLRFHHDQILEVIKTDPLNKTGLAYTYLPDFFYTGLTFATSNEELEALLQKIDGILLVGKLEPQTEQKVLWWKAEGLRALDRKSEAKLILEKARALAPETDLAKGDIQKSLAELSK